MDWNWFFSSVAQSTAAIVGIFSGFIITKILNLQTEYSRNCRLIDEFLNDSEKFIDIAKDDLFDKYNKLTLENGLRDLFPLIQREKRELSCEELYDKGGYSIFISKSEVMEQIKNKLDRLQKGDIAEDELSERIVPIMEEDMINKMKESLINKTNEIRHHVRRLSTFLNNIYIKGETSRLITISIISCLCLFYVGVIYPLHFLPTKSDITITYSISEIFYYLCSRSGIILIIISFIFTLIMIVFLIINEDLRYPIKKIIKLNEYKKIENYSKYIKAYVENN